MDALALCELHHFAVLQVRVQFDLICSDVLGTDGGNRFFHQGDGEVGHADLLGQALSFGLQQRAHELCHGHCICR